MLEYAAVVSVSGIPLTPSRNLGKLWSFIRKGKARLLSLHPLVFQLLYEPTAHVVKTVQAGIDTGRENVGASLLMRHADGTTAVVLSVELETRNKRVTSNMKERRSHRQARRRGERLVRKRRAARNGTEMRNLVERNYPGYENGRMTVKDIVNTEPRFLCRHRQAGWLTPTATNLVRTHVNLIRKLAKWFPISDVSVEIPKFAFMLMEDGTVRGSDFQNGRMKGYTNIRDYVMARDVSSCVACGKPAEHIHHVIPRSRGGSDLPENLACLCGKCHEAVHHGRLTLSSIVSKRHKKWHHLSVLNTSAPFILKELIAIFGEKKVHPVSGIETAAFRREYGLKKFHWMDAVAIVCIGNSLPCPTKMPEEVLKAMRFRRHDRQKINSTTERTYKLDGKVVAKNRRSRFEQKNLSLKDYWNELVNRFGKVKARKIISNLSVRKSTRVRNNMERLMPGAIFVYKKWRFVSSGTHAKSYFRAVGEGNRDFRISECQIVRRNTGIVFLP